MGPSAGEVPSAYTSAQGTITQQGALTRARVVRGKLAVGSRGVEQFV